MFDKRNLEAQVEATLAELAADISAVPAPNEAVVERVKAAVRHEINEQWIAAQTSPLPSPDALRRTRAAVHEELGRVAGGRSGGRLRPQMLAGLSAAAAMAACVGLIRYVGLLQPTTSDSPMLAAAREHVNLFVEAAEYTLAKDEFSESVLNELDSINARMEATSPQHGPEGIVDELDQAIQQVLENSENTDGIMGGASWPQEVVG